MQPLTAFSHDERAGLTGLMCDLDDTLTTDGRLPAKSYDRLERLSDAGLAVIIVTGRPAGWCDLIARLWPVDAVIGENGAVVFRKVGEGKTASVEREWLRDADTRARDRSRLEEALHAAIAAVPGSAPATDNPWRDTDIALDFAEDVAPLSLEHAARAKAVFEAAGATAKISSIHVNAWFGDHDKKTTAFAVLKKHFGLDEGQARQRIAYIGDSPNDAPMFAALDHTIGVANVKRFDLPPASQPRYVTTRDSADGFVELADAILSAKATPGATS